MAVILDIQQRLAGAVRDAARAAFGIDLADVSFQYPPRVELGDLALTAPFDLAKSLRRKPREIAERLAQELGRTPGVRRAEVAGGGYVNLFLDRGAFAAELAASLHEGRAARSRPGHVIVEHTSINPNKAAHIGHIRNACLGDTFVRLLRHRGYDVGVQNYIDDTGVQVADVVVGFLHLEGKTLADVERITGKFDYYCWDLYAKVGDFYAASPANKALQAEALHAIEAGGNDIARLAEHVARRIVDCHLASMARLGIRYDLLAHESDILRLHFWDRAFELLKEKGAVRLQAEGKSAGCWVLPMGEGDDAIDEDKIIVRSNGTVTYTGKDIAYQLWKLGELDRDFRYRLYRTDDDGHQLWTTTSGEGAGGRPGVRSRGGGLQRDRRRPVLPAAGGEGGRRRPRPRGRGGGLPPPRLREGRALPRHGAGPRLRRVRETTPWSRCRVARAWGSRPTTSWTRSWRRPGPRWTRATPRAMPPRARRRPRRWPRARCATS